MRQANRVLKNALGLVAAPYLIVSIGQRPLTRYGLRLQPDEVPPQFGTPTPPNLPPNANFSEIAGEQPAVTRTPAGR